MSQGERKRKMAVVVIAILLQAAIFGVFSYMDSRQTVTPDFGDVRRFALHPVVVVFYGLVPVVVWWCYRMIYAAADNRFWLAALVHNLMQQTVFVVCSYLGSRAVPDKAQVVGLILAAIGTLIASLRWA
jgi:hypothetical protein